MTLELALPLLAIGEGLAAGLLGHKGASNGKGLLKGADFGAQLQQQLGQIGTDAMGVLSQLAGMLQAGTPMANIINRISQEVSGALTNATDPSGGNPHQQRVLQRALASALAPPGTSPPNQSGIEEAAALENRLKNVLSKISRELKSAGQQNRFSGSVLDAKSARETPARQQTKTTAGAQAPSGALASAESILQNVVAQLKADAATQNAPAQTALTHHVATQNAPQQTTDILGRMLARAVNADARRNGSVPIPAAAAAVPGASGHASHPAASASSSQVFARLMHVIAQAANENHSQGGDKQSQGFAFDKSAAPARDHAQPTATGIPAPAFSTALTNATAAAAQSTPAAMPSAIDPQALIEQVVKGMTMRNLGGSSEVRMRLQPENLGDVSLKLTVSGNTISANIIAQNVDVRDMLMSNQQQLARSLAEAGLTLGAFSVDVSGGNPGFSQQQSAQQRSFSKAGAAHLHAIGDDDDSWAESRFGPPVLTGAQSLVLNYLA